MIGKRFVPEKCGGDEKRVKHKQSYDPSFSGEDAMNFYLDVITSANSNNYSNNLIASSTQTPIPRHLNKKPVQHQEPNDKLLTEFLFSAQSNNVHQLQTILNNCPRIINSTDTFGWTALMCAVQSNSIQAVKFLIKNNADVFIQDLKGRTALTLASKSSYVIKLLTNKNNNLTQSKSDEVKIKLIHCKSCKEFYRNDETKRHNSSTIHILNSAKPGTSRICYGIPESNKGFQLLVKEGWNKQMGLGPKGAGQKFPIKTTLKTDRCGLGAKKQSFKVTHFSANDIRAVRSRDLNQHAMNKMKRISLIEKERLFDKKMRLELRLPFVALLDDSAVA